MVTEDQIRLQTKRALQQWQKQWEDHAKIHSKYPMKDMKDFKFSGIGKTIVLAANGYSLEENMETLKNNPVDILACDKSLGHLIRNGIKPKYLMVCDANVNYEKYCEPYKDQLSDTILFMNVCGNPKWTEQKWKDIYFFVNKDVAESEKIFSGLSGCTNFIAAGTNVSNAMVILLTQCDNTARQNFFCYDKMLLVGFDYCWKREGKYYAYDETGDGKSNYMRHAYLKCQSGEDAYTSGNLMFSAKWIEQYVRGFNIPIVQCSRSSVVFTDKYSDLKYQIKYSFKPDDAKLVKEQTEILKDLVIRQKQIQKTLDRVSFEHFYKARSTM